MTEQPNGILFVPERPHHCAPPEIIEWDLEKRRESGIPEVKRWLPTGTVWRCACDRVWVIVGVPPRTYGYTHVVGHQDWAPETRRQRRKRLGLRWWQKEAR